MSRDVVVLTPLAAEGGGAGEYVSVLAEALAPVCDCTVVGPRGEGKQLHGRYWPLFPNWAGQDRFWLRDVTFYAIQNLCYWWFAAWVLYKKPRRVLVSSAFFNHFGCLPMVMRLLRRFSSATFYLDAQDALLPAKRAGCLPLFDWHIAISESVQNHLRQLGADPEKLLLVPVIHKQAKRSECLVDLQRYFPDVAEKKYIFGGGALKPEKGTELLLNAFIEHIGPQHPDYFLVLAGPLKCVEAGFLAKLKHPRVIHVGKLPRPKVLALTAGAQLCVLASFSEGMPRVCLEAIDLQRPTVLPNCVPEFVRYAPECVLPENTAESLAACAERVMRQKLVPAYPVQHHYAPKVGEAYRQLLAS